MTGWEALVSSLGLSFASGVNLYATMLIVGLAQRFELVSGLPEPLQALSNPWVLGVAGVFYLLEFFADKVPFVATVWDGIHTVVRPLGGALIALGAAHELSPLGQAAAMLVGGSVAFSTHSAKAGARMVANTAPEPVTHSAISLAEDLGVFGLAALAITYPWVALAVICGLFLVMAFLAPTIWRTLKFLLSCTWGLMSATLGIEPDPQANVPDWLRKALSDAGHSANAQAYRAFARTNAGGPLYGGGFIVASGGRLLFARKGLFRQTLIELGPAADLVVERGIICDAIVATPTDDQPVMRICLAKHWSRLLQGEMADVPPGVPESA